MVCRVVFGKENLITVVMFLDQKFPQQNLLTVHLPTVFTSQQLPPYNSFHLQTVSTFQQFHPFTPTTSPHTTSLSRNFPFNSPHPQAQKKLQNFKIAGLFKWNFSPSHLHSLFSSWSSSSLWIMNYPSFSPPSLHFPLKINKQFYARSFEEESRNVF
jgi:hypothetical protein